MASKISNVDRLYSTLRQMAADFAFKPDERINESTLATRLGASRTPLREALNRLVAEGFLTFQTGRGFFCRALTPQHILDLYEARVAIESEALRLACTRASDTAIAEITNMLDRMAAGYTARADIQDLLAMDEEFHLALAGLAGNAELVRQLENLNARIRYIRLIDLARMQAGGGEGPGLAAHSAIVTALARRDTAAADKALRDHIEKRREQATEAVRIAYSQLYVPDI